MNTDAWEIVIGLEVHAQIQSESKLFSGEATAFGAEPNQHVSTIDAGFPGMLPVINQTCIRQAIKTGLALNGKINPVSVFARKNYFYPDLPQGYQISQHDQPLVSGGFVNISVGEQNKTIRILRLHVEQDAGKLIHDLYPDYSCVDLNRSGIGLMEIVSEPDLRSADEAGQYLANLRALLRAIGSCDGNMQEGSLRADANVSVRRYDAPLGTRAEIKNLNSIRFLRRAINYEAQRQIDLLEKGQSIIQETRLFDPANGETRSMRKKEDAHDYRYFPEPDLPNLKISKQLIEELQASLPELPESICNRLIKHDSLAYDVAMVIANDRDYVAFFDSLKVGRDPKLVANFLVIEYLGRLAKLQLSLNNSPVEPESFGQLLDLIEAEKISQRNAKDVLDKMLETQKPPAELVKEMGLEQLSDRASLQALIEQLIEHHPQQVSSYRSGNNKVFGWLVGQTIKASKGKANPVLVSQLLRAALDDRPES